MLSKQECPQPQALDLIYPMQCASACIANLGTIHITKSDAAELVEAHRQLAELGLGHQDPLQDAVIFWKDEHGAFHLGQVQKTVIFPPIAPGKSWIEVYEGSYKWSRMDPLQQYQASMGCKAEGDVNDPLHDCPMVHGLHIDMVHEVNTYGLQHRQVSSQCL